MKQKIEPRRRAKLPPILDIDEEDTTMDVQAWSRPRWSADDDAPGGLQLDDWPTEFDD